MQGLQIDNAYIRQWLYTLALCSNTTSLLFRLYSQRLINSTLAEQERLQWRTLLHVP